MTHLTPTPALAPGRDRQLALLAQERAPLAQGLGAAADAQSALRAAAAAAATAAARAFALADLLDETLVLWAGAKTATAVATERTDPASYPGNALSPRE